MTKTEHFIFKSYDIPTLDLRKPASSSYYYFTHPGTPGDISYDLSHLRKRRRHLTSDVDDEYNINLDLVFNKNSSVLMSI